MPTPKPYKVYTPESGSVELVEKQYCLDLVRKLGRAKELLANSHMALTANLAGESKAEVLVDIEDFFHDLHENVSQYKK